MVSGAPFLDLSALAFLALCQAATYSTVLQGLPASSAAAAAAVAVVATASVVVGVAVGPIAQVVGKEAAAAIVTSVVSGFTISTKESKQASICPCPLQQQSYLQWASSIWGTFIPVFHSPP